MMYWCLNRWYRPIIECFPAIFRYYRQSLLHVLASHSIDEKRPDSPLVTLGISVIKLSLLLLAFLQSVCIYNTGLILVFG